MQSDPQLGAPVRSSRVPLLGVVVTVLCAATLVLCWLLGGVAGWAYLLIYGVMCVPGLPIGFALFGRRHAAGWVAGALAGYAITALALWIPVQLRMPVVPVFVLSWIVAALLVYFALRRVGPLATLPLWTRRDSLALILVLVAVPLLLWRPFTNIGAVDDQGNRRYRAYFTADFLWHVALTAELARAEMPPRNPYLVRRALNYYWAYFIPPAVASRSGLLPSTQSYLTINALCAGLLFVAAIFIAAWSAVPRAGPVMTGTLLALIAASAEGLYAVCSFWQQGRSLGELRNLNVDAVTAWFHRGLTIDGLPRSLWYTPQHATACALSLMAMIVPLYAPALRPSAGILAGIFLGLALIFSPFLGGAFSLIYGLLAIWIALRSPSRSVRLNADTPVGALMTTAPAVLPVLGALGWCIGNGTFEGAGGVVRVGVSRLAAAAPVAMPALALGPLLCVALPSLVLRRRGFRTEGAIAALVVGFLLLYFVTLTSEPIWIGWRAGQILLVTLPALAAAAIATLHEYSPRLTVSLTAAAFSVGVPTTIIDMHNAQDVANTQMGPGFRWTVVVRPETQAALEWIRCNTPADAVVQMSIAPRGRETWTLIPTFAERRMAAGQPISLLWVPEYAERSAQADAIFSTQDAGEAAALARRLRVDYIFVDSVERQAFGDAAIGKFSDARYFVEVFRRAAAAVFAVR